MAIDIEISSQSQNENSTSRPARKHASQGTGSTQRTIMLEDRPTRKGRGPRNCRQPESSCVPRPDFSPKEVNLFRLHKSDKSPAIHASIHGDETPYSMHSACSRPSIRLGINHHLNPTVSCLTLLIPIGVEGAGSSHTHGEKLLLRETTTRQLMQNSDCLSRR